MKKQIATLIPSFKSALQLVDGNISARGEELNQAFEAELKKVSEDLTIDQFNKVMLTVANSSNAIVAAAAEISAEGFKADEDLKDVKFEATLGTQISLGAGWEREKTVINHNPKTREEMPPVTHRNFMTGSRLVIQGVGSKAVRQHSREYAASLFE